MKFELLKGNLFTSREFRLRTNVVDGQNCESTYLATFYITETIVTKLNDYHRTSATFRTGRDFSNFLLWSYCNIWLLDHGITTHTCNRVGQARVLFHMVYIAQFSNALFRTPKYFSIAVCAVDFEFQYTSCAIVSAGIEPNKITPSNSCRY